MNVAIYPPKHRRAFWSVHVERYPNSEIALFVPFPTYGTSRVGLGRSKVMNTGMRLEELAIEMKRQTSPDVRKDYIAPLNKMSVVQTLDGAPHMVLDGQDPAGPILPVADGQLSSYLDIPKKYYDLLKHDEPREFSRHMTERFHARDDARMIRTLDGQVRAVLSPRYRPLDNYYLADRAVLPALVNNGAQVVSSHINESRMMIKATSPDLMGEVKSSRRINDFVRGGIVVGNNEVGQGSFYVEAFMEFLSCVNGMITSKLLKKFHVGQRAEIDADAYEMLSDDTRRKDDQLLWQKAREIISGAFNVTRFEKSISRLEDITEQRVDDKGAKVQDVVELTVDHLALPPATGESILDNLIKGDDLSRYGLMNAVTQAANTIEDYDVSTQLERAGGTIMNMPESEWASLTAA